MRKRRIRKGARVGVAALLALSMVAAACGDDDEEASTDESTEVTPAPTTEAVETSAAGGPETSADAPGTTESEPETTAEGPETSEEPPETSAAPPASSAPSDDGIEQYDDSELDLDATMNVTNDGNPATLDPHLEPTQGSTPYWMPLYDPLTSVVISGEVNPRLAESWEFSDDGLTLTFHIREGVTFHDGTPLDGNAVKISLDRARSAEASTQKGVLSAISDVQADGMDVVLTLSAYDPALPWVLGTAAGAVINPKAIEAGTDLTGTSDGTGPYVVTEFVPNESVTYERAEDTNWDPAVGKLAGFTINFLTDYQVALNGLQAGQFDMIRVNGLGGAIEQALDTGDFTRTEVPSLQTLAFWLNNQDPAFADVRVRQAFQYALDREGIANAVFDGGSECAPASQAYPFIGDDLYVEGYDPYPYDADQARQLLEEANAVGTPLTITDIGATNTGNLMQAAQPMLEEVGFEVELVRGTAAEVAPGFQRGEFQVAVIPNAKQAHGTITLKRYWLTGGPYNLAENEDQPLLDVLAEISTPDATEEEIAAGNEEIARILAEDIATLVVACNVVWAMVHDNDVVNIHPRSLFLNMRTAAVLADD